MSTYIIVKDELSHYGVKGMKWGVRKQLPIISSSRNRASSMSDSERIAMKRQRAKKAAIIGGSIVAAGLVTYGGYKLRNKKVLEMANNYAHRMYGKSYNYFDDVKSAKENWYGSRRAMMKDIRGFSDRSIARRQRRYERDLQKQAKQAAQNTYISSMMNTSTDKLKKYI